MALLSLDHPWAFTFGILGNIISCMVYLSPMPTFYRVYRKKSTEGFQCVPYVVALFSAMLWIYYALLKPNSYLLITINTIGCIIETAYIIVYLVYAPKKAKICTAKLLVVLNVGLFGLILVLTLLLSRGRDRIRILGWVCVGFSVSVFVAPLSIIRLVIRTKSVEFMPFSLSFFLTVSAVIWFSYGLLTKDKYIALPNVVGFVFGIIQMVLYTVYKKSKQLDPAMEIKLPEHPIEIAKLGPTEKTFGVHPIEEHEHNSDQGNRNARDDDNNNSNKCRENNEEQTIEV
ncbi:bidirectional sugar transporter SWEET14-like [Carex rostrata]